LPNKNTLKKSAIQRLLYTSAIDKECLHRITTASFSIGTFANDATFFAALSSTAAAYESTACIDQRSITIARPLLDGPLIDVLPKRIDSFLNDHFGSFAKWCLVDLK
jgi:hypothetical protein